MNGDKSKTMNRDRPSKEPGGMECQCCGCIFVGSEWHTLCRVCEEKVGTTTYKPQSTSMLEKMCRTICKAEDVDPDQESVGIGAIMPAGQPYKLWEARKRVAEALIAEGFGDV